MSLHDEIEAERQAIIHDSRLQLAALQNSLAQYLTSSTCAELQPTFVWRDHSMLATLHFDGMQMDMEPAGFTSTRSDRYVITKLRCVGVSTPSGYRGRDETFDAARLNVYLIRAFAIELTRDSASGVLSAIEEPANTASSPDDLAPPPTASTAG
jgi:hypothetical protein